MAVDVIIDPLTGQIYWNDSQSTAQSIAISGNGSDIIKTVGYSLQFNAAPSGTITASASTTSITGSGTNFTTLFGNGASGAGAILYTIQGTSIGTVGVVTSDTALRLSTNAAGTFSSVAFRYTPPTGTDRLIFSDSSTPIYPATTGANLGDSTYRWFLYGSRADITNSATSAINLLLDKSSLGSAEFPALQFINTTLATTSAQYQFPPWSEFRGQAWNSTSSASNDVRMRVGMAALSGSTPSSELVIASSVDTGTASWYYPLTLNVTSNDSVMYLNNGVLSIGKLLTNGNTSSYGLELYNYNLATSGQTANWSPAFEMNGSAWNSTTSSSNILRLRSEVQTVSGGTISGSIVWKSAITTSYSVSPSFANLFSISHTSGIGIWNSNTAASYLKAASNQSSEIRYTLPPTAPSASQSLTATSVSGANILLGWTTVTGGSGSGTVNSGTINQLAYYSGVTTTASAAGLVYNSSGTTLTVTASGVSSIPLRLSGVASQSSDLFQVGTSAGNPVLAVNAAGIITSGIWNASLITTGYGGTGTSVAPTSWGIIFGNASQTYSATGTSTGSNQTILSVTGGAPVWGALSLGTASSVTGTLAVSNGGTGVTNIGAGRIMYGNNTGAVATDSRFTWSGANQTLTLDSATTTASNLLITKNDNQTGSFLGLQLANTTAATSVISVQQSPALEFSARVWNTTPTAANNFIKFRQEVQGTSGTNPVGIFVIKSSLDTTDTPTFTDRFKINTSGLIATFGVASQTADLFQVNTSAGTVFAVSALGTITSGVWNGTLIGVPYGGTGQSTYTDGQLLIGNSTGNTLTKATLSQGTNIAITNGGGSITIGISGTIGVANGGTGATAFTGGTVILANSNGTSLVSVAAAGSVNRWLYSTGSATTNLPAWSTPTLANSYNQYDIVYAGTANALSGLANTATSVLISNTAGPIWLQGTTANRHLKTSGGAITWALVDLSTDVTGTLGLTNGGTGLSAAGTGNYILGMNSGGTALEYKQLNQGSNVTITQAANSITIAASGNGTVSAGTTNQLAIYSAATTVASAAGLVYSNSGTHLTITSQSATIIPMQLTGASAQSVDLFRVATSAGTIFAINSIGFVTSGTWNASTIAINYGGTNTSSFSSSKGVILFSGTNLITTNSLASGILVTDGSSNPSIATDIPTGVTIGGSYVYRASGTDVSLSDGGTNASLTAASGGVVYSTTAALAITAAGTAGNFLKSSGTSAPTWSAITLSDSNSVTGTLGLSNGGTGLTSTSPGTNYILGVNNANNALEYKQLTGTGITIVHSAGGISIASASVAPGTINQLAYYSGTTTTASTAQISYNSAGTTLTITASSATSNPLKLIAAASQTANFFTVENSSGNSIFTISPTTSGPSAKVTIAGTASNQDDLFSITNGGSLTVAGNYAGQRGIRLGLRGSGNSQDAYIFTIQNSAGDLTPFVFSADGTTGYGMQINQASSGFPLSLKVPEDSTGNTVKDVISIERTTSGLATSGIGARISYRIEQNAGTSILAASMDAILSDTLNATYAGALIFNTNNVGLATSLAERVRINNVAVTLSPVGTGAGNTNELRFLELALSGTNFTSFKAPDSLADHIIYTLPTTVPTANQILAASSVTGTSVTLAWANDATGSGGSGTVSTGTINRLAYYSGTTTTSSSASMAHASSGSLLTITSQATTDNPLLIKGIASQTGTLLDVQNSASATQFSVGPTGDLISAGTSIVASGLATVTLGSSATTLKRNINIGTGGIGTTNITVGSSVGTSTINLRGKSINIGGDSLDATNYNETIYIGGQQAFDAGQFQNINIGASQSTANQTLNIGSGQSTVVNILSMLNVAPTQTAGSASTLQVTGADYGATPASTEIVHFNFIGGEELSKATGAQALARTFNIQGATYNFAGASTITNAATLQISTAPVAGTNASITEKASLRVLTNDNAAKAIVIRSNSNTLHTANLLEVQNASGTALFAIGGLGAGSITAQSAAITPLILTGASGQTADIFRVSTSAATAFAINFAGVVTSGTWNGSTIPVAYGGTGQSTYSDGQLLIGNTAGGLTKAALTAGSGASVTNGNGSITIKTKRVMNVQIASGLNPTLGPDTAIVRIPESPTDGTTSLSYVPRSLFCRVETPSAGTSSFNIDWYNGTSAFSTTGILLTSTLNVTGASVYEYTSTAFATTVIPTGTKFRLNFSNVDTAQSYFSINLLMEEIVT